MRRLPSSPRKRGPITPVLIARAVIMDSRFRGNDGEVRQPCASPASSPRKPGPITPLLVTRAVIMDSRFRRNDGALPPRGVTLHAACIGGGAAARADAGRRGEAAFRPVGADFDLVAAALELVDGLLRHAALDHEEAGLRGARPERAREMLGVPGRRVDRLLHVHAGVNMTQKE